METFLNRVVPEGRGAPWVHTDEGERCRTVRTRVCCRFWLPWCIAMLQHALALVPAAVGFRGGSVLTCALLCACCHAACLPLPLPGPDDMPGVGPGLQPLVWREVCTPWHALPHPGACRSLPGGLVCCC